MSTSASAVAMQPLSGWKCAGAGALAGLLAGIVMTVGMLLLAQIFGLATPMVLLGDRLSVFIPADAFLQLMGRVGGYNHMKQLGVSSVMGGQLLLGALGGMVYGLLARGRKRPALSVGLFTVLPLLAVTVALWPVLGTHYGGLPIPTATVVTILGLLVSFVLFERTLSLSYAGMTGRPRSVPPTAEYSPPIGRRALLVGGLGLILAGGGAGLLRKLFRVATFSYDGTQYRGRDVQAITPNEEFYCVTKNVIDPRVNAAVWRLEVTGLVGKERRFDLAELLALPAVTQETTLMCISNGLDAGLMSNAVWKGVSMGALLAAAGGPLPAARKVKLHGVDNYTDTFPLEKALEPTTLLAYEMNGARLPDRHGFPMRAIVPGYFGEKHVKWITRIELATEEAEGFYEKQGWGPDFTVPTRTRVDQPAHDDWIALADLRAPVLVKGVAFGGDRGISRVEFTADDGRTWADARLDYPGTRLTWALWSFDWRPPGAGDHVLWARATNGDGVVQTFDPKREFKSGTSGFHKIVVHIS
ncbi:MAG: molybdopterin-dependent oxidoreductase [Chthoniobacterales bacterium]